MDPSNYSAGIAQISRAVWNNYTKLPYKDAADPKFYKENMEISAKYLKSLEMRFGNWRLALMAYNMGPGNLHAYLNGRHALSPITVRYVAGFGG